MSPKCHNLNKVLGLFGTHEPIEAQHLEPNIEVHF